MAEPVFNTDGGANAPKETFLYNQQPNATKRPASMTANDEVTTRKS